MKRNLLSKILGIGVAASTVVALAGALFTASPAAADTTKWSSIDTPSFTDGVILPASNILDYDISGADGNTIYVIAEVDRVCAEDNPFLAEIEFEEGTDGGTETVNFPYGLFKSTDGGVTWTDITQNVLDTDNLPSFDEAAVDADDGTTADDILSLNYVAVAPDDPDWVAVTGYGNNADATTPDPNLDPPFTVASKDGGDNFAFTGEMEDDANNTSMDLVYDTEVSPETEDGLHIIAAMGANNGVGNTGQDQPGFQNFRTQPDEGTVFLLTGGTWLGGSWEDASFYDGWDGGEEGNVTPADETIHSLAEVDGEFSPNFADDGAIVVIGVVNNPDGFPNQDFPYVQTGSVIAKAWGEEASFPEPVQIESDGEDLWLQPGIWVEGITLPADYDANDTGTRVVFGFIDAYNSVSGEYGGWLFRLDDESETSMCSPDGNPLASIDISGDADAGKVMIGEFVIWDNTINQPVGSPVQALPCDGVKVWHTQELDFCCPNWDTCCTFKCPSGPYAARVRYTPDGQKEYATTTGSQARHYFNGYAVPTPVTGLGTPGDESAFSVSLDEGTSWNQLSLIDTTIDRLSDQVICPDCSVMYLSTINDGDPPDYACEDFTCPTQGWWFACDSVWRSFDNGATWERVFHGDWASTETTTGVAGTDVGAGFDGVNPGEFDPDVTGELLLRLPCSDTENCCDITDLSAPSGTVYLGLQNTNDMFYSRDCGQCWTETPETRIDIQDFAVDTESTVYVIDDLGSISKSTNFGRRWSDSIDTGINSGHMIALCCAQGLILVGGFGDDPVAWSDDGGDTWNQTDDVPIDGGDVHVACATTCDNIIYIAVNGGQEQGNDEESTGAGESGIYRGDLTDGSWTNMNAPSGVDYTGIAVGKSDGTLYVSTNFITVNDNEGNKAFLNADGKWTPCSRTFAEEAEVNFTDDTAAERGDRYVVSAVLRDLDPCSTECCGAETWDVLFCGLDEKCHEVTPPAGDNVEQGAPSVFICGECEGQDFDAEVNALDICGCLTATTNTKLWAIDSREYDVRNGDEGTIWTYEDCASKIGPTLVSPANNSVIECQGCEGCGAGPFTLKWNRMCNACSYDIEIMDDQGNVVVDINDTLVTGTSCNFFFDTADLFPNGTSPLVCGNSYTWHVREANTDCECIHSRWSDTWAFTVAVSTANGVQLVAPKMSATDIGTENTGFSWEAVTDATSYSFVLSPNANLSSALASQEISTTAFNYAGPLDNSKTYYWQVKAWKDTTLLSTSDVGVFTVVPAPVAPQAPTVVAETPPPQINIPATQQVTPTWIYLAVGIAIALVVVVVILVTRTRRH